MCLKGTKNSHTLFWLVSLNRGVENVLKSRPWIISPTTKSAGLSCSRFKEVHPHTHTQPRTHAHTHTHTHTHTNTHARMHAHAHSPAHTHTHKHARTNTRTRPHTHTHTHTHTRTHKRTPAPARTHTHTHSRTNAQTRPPTPLTHTHARAPAHTHTHTRSRALTHTHTLTNTHTHTHTHTLTHAHTCNIFYSIICHLHSDFFLLAVQFGWYTYLLFPLVSYIMRMSPFLTFLLYPSERGVLLKKVYCITFTLASVLFSVPQGAITWNELWFVFV